MENFHEVLLTIRNHFFVWQTLVGSLIGALAPLFVLWCAEVYKDKKEEKKYLYYLQRLIVDQINSTIEAKVTTEKFLNGNITKLIRRIDSDKNNAYSVGAAFFPQFSVRKLPDDINNRSSGSGYIDNKIAKIYALSNDLPHMFDDIRLQLKFTLETNEKVSFAKLNSPEVQREQFKANVIEYDMSIREDMLNKNIPLYFKKLAEALVAVEEKSRSNAFLWKLKFDPKYKFFLNKKSYFTERKKVVGKMDLYFKSATDEKLIEIEKASKEE